MFELIINLAVIVAILFVGIRLIDAYRESCKGNTREERAEALGKLVARGMLSTGEKTDKVLAGTMVASKRLVDTAHTITTKEKARFSRIVAKPVEFEIQGGCSYLRINSGDVTVTLRYDSADNSFSAWMINHKKDIHHRFASAKELLGMLNMQYQAGHFSQEQMVAAKDFLKLIANK